MLTTFFLLWYFLCPAIILCLCYRFPVLQKIGAVVICYLVGITAGNLHVFPAGFDKMQLTLGDILIAVSLPLLLFSMDMRKWSCLAGQAMLCMVLGICAVVIVTFIAYLCLRSSVPDAWKVAAMGIGVYVGGTPNLFAIKAALGVDTNTFVLVYTYDTVFSMLYVFFCLTVAQRVFGLLLPKFHDTGVTDAETGLEVESIQSYRDMLGKDKIIPLVGALCLAVLISVTAALSTHLVSQHYATVTAILAITTLSIGCSFIPAVHRIERTFQLGIYLIMVFCLVVSSMVNWGSIISVHYPLVFFIVFSIFGSMLLHAIFCRLFNIDTDTFIIINVSLIMSPPFVPPIAAALNNKTIVLSGIISGIIGYAIGNYLGISMGYCFRWLVS
jgi:uncharacterized membrane protein